MYLYLKKKKTVLINELRLPADVTLSFEVRIFKAEIG